MNTIQKTIELDFDHFVIDATLFDSSIATRFAELLPIRVSLTSWGNEVYGSVGADLGEESPIPEIPEGGLAYTSQGNYFCIFFGQSPAWPVEYIGRIEDDQWRQLLDYPNLSSVYVKLKEAP